MVRRRLKETSVSSIQTGTIQTCQSKFNLHEITLKVRTARIQICSTLEQHTKMFTHDQTFNIVDG